MSAPTIGILPANYVAAVDALKALDAETRRLCRRAVPTEPAAIAAELKYWQAVLAVATKAQDQACHIQARAIRGGGAIAAKLSGASTGDRSP